MYIALAYSLRRSPIRYNQLSRQAGANCRAHHDPPSPAAPPLQETVPLCEIKIRAARGKFPSGDGPGGFICLHLNTKRVPRPLPSDAVAGRFRASDGVFGVLERGVMRTFLHCIA